MDIHIRFGSVVVSTFGKQSFTVFNFHFYERFLSVSCQMSQPASTTASRPTSDPSRDEDHGTKKKKKKKPSPTVSSTAFVGKCEDIKEHVYERCDSGQERI